MMYGIIFIMGTGCGSCMMMSGTWEMIAAYGVILICVDL